MGKDYSFDADIWGRSTILRSLSRVAYDHYRPTPEPNDIHSADLPFGDSRSAQGRHEGGVLHRPSRVGPSEDWSPYACPPGGEGLCQESTRAAFHGGDQSTPYFQGM